MQIIAENRISKSLSIIQAILLIRAIIIGLLNFQLKTITLTQQTNYNNQRLDYVNILNLSPTLSSQLLSNSKLLLIYVQAIN